MLLGPCIVIVAIYSRIINLSIRCVWVKKMGVDGDGVNEVRRLSSYIVYSIQKSPFFLALALRNLQYAYVLLIKSRAKL